MASKPEKIILNRDEEHLSGYAEYVARSDEPGNPFLMSVVLSDVEYARIGSPAQISVTVEAVDAS